MSMAGDDQLEVLTDIQESIEDERKLWESIKTERMNEQSALKVAKVELTAYKEKVISETQQWVTDQQGMISARKRKQDARETKLTKREETARSNTAKNIAAKRAINKLAKELSGNQREVKANLIRTTNVRKEAEKELKNVSDTLKQAQRKLKDIDNTMTKIANTRKDIEAELDKARKLSLEQRDIIVKREAELKAGESALQIAAGKMKLDWASLKSRESALKAGIDEYKLEGKV